MIRALPYVVYLALTLYALIGCLQTDESAARNLPKLGWAVVILLFPFVGAIAWLVAGRPEQGGQGGNPFGPRQAQQCRPRGPDDDPDFLSGL